MDVKLIPGDRRGRAVTANMLTGLLYTVDPTDGNYVQSFDCGTIVPHVADRRDVHGSRGPSSWCR